MISKQAIHLGLQQNTSATIPSLCDLLQLLHEAISDGHARESLFATVCPWHGVASKPRYERQVHAKGIRDPIHSRSTLLAQHLDEIWTTGTTPHRVFREDLRAVINLQVPLRPCQCAVDATGCF